MLLFLVVYVFILCMEMHAHGAPRDPSEYVGVEDLQSFDGFPPNV